MPNDWPNSIPADLRRRLENVLSCRNHGAPELWGEVRAWLIAHEVEAPDILASFRGSMRRKPPRCRMTCHVLPS